MSRQFNTNNKNFNANTKNNVNSRKPFCKVCADAGKTDTAHFPRKTPDPNSEVVCPTLLSLECRYCFKNGHTIKYCVVLKDRKNFEEQERREHDRFMRQEERRLEQDRLARLPPVVPKISAGKFTALLEETEEEERLEARIAEEQTRFDLAVQQALLKKEAEFPSFVSKKVITSSAPTTNWAVMASNAAQLAVPKPKVNVIVAPVAPSNGHWADDSDDEEDEPMYESVVNNNDHVNITYCYVRATADDDDW